MLLQTQQWTVFICIKKVYFKVSVVCDALFLEIFFTKENFDCFSILQHGCRETVLFFIHFKTWVIFYSSSTGVVRQENSEYIGMKNTLFPRENSEFSDISAIFNMFFHTTWLPVNFLYQHFLPLVRIIPTMTSKWQYFLFVLKVWSKMAVLTLQQLVKLLHSS